MKNQSLNQSWLLVANSSMARLFTVKNMDQLTELHTFTHPESRLPEQDLISSKPGRSFDRMGKHRHMMEPPTTQKRQEFEQFAKAISDYLDEARKEATFSRLYVAAGPTFLGTLRKAFHPQVLELIEKEISKDLVHSDQKQILEELFG